MRIEFIQLRAIPGVGQPEVGEVLEVDERLGAQLIRQGVAIEAFDPLGVPAEERTETPQNIPEIIHAAPEPAPAPEGPAAKPRRSRAANPEQPPAEPTVTEVKIADGVGIADG